MHTLALLGIGIGASVHSIELVKLLDSLLIFLDNDLLPSRPQSAHSAVQQQSLELSKSWMPGFKRHKCGSRTPLGYKIESGYLNRPSWLVVKAGNVGKTFLQRSLLAVNNFV